MTLQNRVTPLGDIVAAEARGLFTGNRGIIHDPATRTLLTRRWTNPAWLVCALQWRDVRRDVMATRSWTELFFLDEATALAAGHRPCFYCRRAAAEDFRACFPRTRAAPPPSARDMDRTLHAERLQGRAKRLHDLPARSEPLPDGAFILQGGVPHLVFAGAALPWSWAGYGAPTKCRSDARLVTPPSVVAALRGGYRPAMHDSVVQTCGTR